mgnify:CR=1 FL=1
MIQAILEFIEKNSTFVSIVTNAFVGIVGFFSNKGWEKLKKTRTIFALRLVKERDCKIVMPIYENIDLHPKINSKTLFSVNEQSDVLASLNIISLIEKIGLRFDEEYYVLQEHCNQVIANSNVFCIGGVVANEQTKVYFSKFFPEFRIFSKNIEMKDAKGQNIYAYNKAKRGFCWGNGKEFTVSEGENYAILIRLTKEDFNIKDAGTVYILFGDKADSTLMASKYLLCHMDDLLKRTKGKKHFFIVMRIREANGIKNAYFDENYDLTKEMFPPKNERRRR